MGSSLAGLIVSSHTRVRGKPTHFMADFNAGAARENRTTPFTSWMAEAMRLRRLTPKQLAGRAGLSQSMVSMLLSGTREPTRENVQKIANGLAPEGDEMEREALEKAARLAAGFVPDPDDSEDSLILEREYQTPDGENFKIYGLGELPPEVLDAIAGDVDRRMREWEREERLKRYETASGE